MSPLIMSLSTLNNIIQSDTTILIGFSFYSEHQKLQQTNDHTLASKGLVNCL